MPLYEYSCRNCSSEFELLVRGKEKPQCPTCASSKLERLLSVPAAHTIAARDLPVCRPTTSEGCGSPQCGMGGCMME